jgi:hypothetical protein
VVGVTRTVEGYVSQVIAPEDLDRYAIGDLREPADGRHLATVHMGLLGTWRERLVDVPILRRLAAIGTDVVHVALDEPDVEEGQVVELELEESVVESRTVRGDEAERDVLLWDVDEVETLGRRGSA